jgi:hypothetical protein
MRFRLNHRILATAALVAAAACSPSSVVEVETPDVATPGSLLTPLGLDALRAAAFSEFTFANSGDAGGTEGHIQVTGLFTDEFPLNDTFQGRFELDARQTTDRNDRLLPFYRALHRARRAAEFAARSTRRISTTPNSDFRIPEMQIFDGFTHLLLAETFCSPQPIGTYADDGTETFGPPLSRTAVVNRGIAKIDSALAYIAGASPALAAGTRDRLTRFGTVLKARALMYEGRYTEAQALVPALSAIPVNFRETTTHSTASGRQNNGVHVFNWLSARYSVAERDGAGPTELAGPIPAGVGLNFRGANDSRIRVLRAGNAFDGASPLFRLGKYNERTTPITIADYTEAQLILAELELQAGNEAYLNRLNNLRATQSLYPLDPFAGGAPSAPPVMPPLAAVSPGVIDAADVDLLFRERAFWLYATGHRLGDLRRLIRNYGRTEAEVFPGGGGRPYFLENQNLARVNRIGIPFGPQVSFTVPVQESNNPDFVACNPNVP